MDEDQTQEAPPQAVPEPKKKKKGFLKTFLIAVVAAVLAFGAGYYFYGSKLMAHYAEKQAEIKKPEKVEVGPILSLEPFVINVSGSSSKFVKISVAMELKNEKAVEQTRKMAPVVRDAMLSILAAKTPEAFMDITGRKAMKQELFEAVNQLFADGGLKAVYITDIIMQ